MFAWCINVVISDGSIKVVIQNRSLTSPVTLKMHDWCFSVVVVRTHEGGLRSRDSVTFHNSVNKAADTGLYQYDVAMAEDEQDVPANGQEVAQDAEEEVEQDAEEEVEVEKKPRMSYVVE